MFGTRRHRLVLDADFGQPLLFDQILECERVGDLRAAKQPMTTAPAGTPVDRRGLRKEGVREMDRLQTVAVHIHEPVDGLDADVVGWTEVLRSIDTGQPLRIDTS